MTKQKEQELESKIDNLTDIVEKLTGVVTRVLSYIESDAKTGRKGMYEQQEVNMNKIDTNKEEIGEIRDGIKTDKKVMTGKVGVVTLIFSAIGWVILKLLGLVKLTI